MSNTFPGYLKERLPLVEQALSRVAASPLDGTSCATADLSRYLYAPLAHFTSGAVCRRSSLGTKGGSMGSLLRATPWTRWARATRS